MLRKGVLLALLLNLAACEMEPGDYTKLWTLSGQIVYSGTLNANAKVGAFYCAGGWFFAFAPTTLLVSNILGSMPTGSAFSLTIDVSQIAPQDGDAIWLVRWNDTNGNNTYDNAESSFVTEPRTGDLSFLGADQCGYDFKAFKSNYNTPSSGYGWNQNIANYDSVPVDSANRTGAVIGLN